MTTEEDFLKHLDANPTDFHTRLVFADWLQDRNDRRAAGYRALGVCRFRAYVVTDFHTGPPIEHLPGWGVDDNTSYNDEERYRHCLLPRDWYRAVRRTRPNLQRGNQWWVQIPGVRVTEDIAALAFLKLTPARRDELLTPSAAG